MSQGAGDEPGPRTPSLEPRAQVGIALAIGLLIFSFLRRSDDLKRVAFEVVFVVALLTIPAYFSGVSAQQAQLNNPDFSELFVDAHWTAALWAFLMMQISGAFAWLALWKYRRTARMSAALLAAVLLLSTLGFAASARAANLGGEIRHPEIIVAGVTRGAGRTPARSVRAHRESGGTLGNRSD